MKKIVIIDGQGGRMGSLLTEKLKEICAARSSNGTGSSGELCSGNGSGENSKENGSGENSKKSGSRESKAPSLHKSACEPVEICAVGTNGIATSAMMKAGADYGATGENPVLVNVRDADLIIGPIGILCADALFGEVTPRMAVAVGQSHAEKILLPVNKCRNHIVGISDLSLSALVQDAVRYAEEWLREH